MTTIKVLSVSQKQFEEIKELDDKITEARLIVGLIRKLKLENIVLKMLRGY